MIWKPLFTWSLLLLEFFFSVVTFTEPFFKDIYWLFQCFEIKIFKFLCDIHSQTIVFLRTLFFFLNLRLHSILPWRPDPSLWQGILLIHLEHSQEVNVNKIFKVTVWHFSFSCLRTCIRNCSPFQNAFVFSNPFHLSPGARAKGANVLAKLSELQDAEEALGTKRTELETIDTELNKFRSSADK